MECRNHPGTAATATCAGCAEAYCDNCLLTVRGTRYCAACKGLAVTGPGSAPPPVVEAQPCPEANEALKYAIFGLFCIGIVLAPIAIKKGIDARRKIAANPGMAGSGTATSAIVIGSLALLLWVVGIMARVAGRGR
jgi:hypothetical protein